MCLEVQSQGSSSLFSEEGSLYPELKGSSLSLPLGTIITPYVSIKDLNSSSHYQGKPTLHKAISPATVLYSAVKTFAAKHGRHLRYPSEPLPESCACTSTRFLHVHTSPQTMNRHIYTQKRMQPRIASNVLGIQCEPCSQYKFYLRTTLLSTFQ